TLVTIVRMVLEKYIPALYDSMGLYLPLIVVNCIILGRAEAFASKNPVLASALDGAATGLGFTFALTIMGIIREFFGSGSIFGLQIADIKIGFFSSAAGAFLVYGLCIAIFTAITSSVEQSSLKKKGMTLRKDLLPQEVDS
ncbi:MAG: Rnf-Nqr domain containing protein, partial [Christensenellaceae bacterium]